MKRTFLKGTDTLVKIINIKKISMFNTETNILLYLQDLGRLNY